MQSRPFKYLSTFKEAEANAIALIASVYEKHQETKKALAKVREEQMILIGDVIDALNEDKNTAITEEMKVRILTGVVRHVKKLISKEYEGFLWSRISKPENSTLYSGNDKAVGITTENTMDENAEKDAISAFQAYLPRLAHYRAKEEIKKRNENKEVAYAPTNHVVVNVKGPMVKDLVNDNALHFEQENKKNSQEEKKFKGSDLTPRERFQKFENSYSAYHTFKYDVLPAIEKINKLSAEEKYPSKSYTKALKGDFVKVQEGTKTQAAKWRKGIEAEQFGKPAQGEVVKDEKYNRKLLPIKSLSKKLVSNMVWEKKQDGKKVKTDQKEVTTSSTWALVKEHKWAEVKQSTEGKVLDNTIPRGTAGVNWKTKTITDPTDPTFYLANSKGKACELDEADKKLQALYRKRAENVKLLNKEIGLFNVAKLKPVAPKADATQSLKLGKK